MIARDIPEVATPWEDPFGVTWYCVSDGNDNFVMVYRTAVGGRRMRLGAYMPMQLSVDFLTHLGRTLPPVPTPKRVAPDLDPIEEAVMTEVRAAYRKATVYWAPELRLQSSPHAHRLAHELGEAARRAWTSFREEAE